MSSLPANLCHLAADVNHAPQAWLGLPALPTLFMPDNQLRSRRAQQQLIEAPGAYQFEELAVERGGALCPRNLSTHSAHLSPALTCPHTGAHQLVQDY